MHRHRTLQLTAMLLALALAAASLSADVIHLKNGRVIKGQIIEHKPDVSYKIRTADGSIFVFEVDQVTRVEFTPSEQVTRPQMRPEHVPGRKSPWGAVLGAWLLPTVGHAYAGDWGRGALFGLAEVGTLALFIAGSEDTEVQCSWYSCEEELTDSGATKVLVGGIGFLVFRIWEFFDAYDTAQDYNRRLERQYGLALSPVGGTPALSLTYRF